MTEVSTQTRFEVQIYTATGRLRGLAGESQQIEFNDSPNNPHHVFSCFAKNATDALNQACDLFKAWGHATGTEYKTVTGGLANEVDGRSLDNLLGYKLLACLTCKAYSRYVFKELK